MIGIRDLSRRYGPSTAVDRPTFTVAPGRVTGFLGPDGAGRSTTLRMILGLERPGAGRALVLGRPYRELPEPLRRVGALLDADAAHPGRSARGHLAALAGAPFPWGAGRLGRPGKRSSRPGVRCGTIPG